MAHFARVENGTVREVIVVSNDVLVDDPEALPAVPLEFPDSEPVGQAFIGTLPGLGDAPGQWLQCSYSGSFRGMFPGLGFTYDEGLDEFVAPTPGP